MPDANVGIVLNDLPIVAIDVDGPVGRRSLEHVLLAVGRAALPDTFTVTTGRLDGGQHRLYRLPPGAVKLPNQLGQHQAETPALDIIFQGLVIAPGSVHKSGLVYTGNRAEIPPVADLGLLPQEFYDYLLRRRRSKHVQQVTKGAQKRRERRQHVSGGGHYPTVPAALQTLLVNTSDGRDGRTLKSVTMLVRLNWDDSQIMAAVLDFPLGRKALEQSDPDAWLRHKIDTARQWSPSTFDKAEFWSFVHTSGLASGKLRILDVMLDRASKTGVVTMPLALIAINSALATAKKAVRELIDDGWMSVIAPGDRRESTTYLLHSYRHDGQDVQGEPQAGQGRQGQPTTETVKATDVVRSKDVVKAEDLQVSNLKVGVLPPSFPTYLIALYGNFPVNLVSHDAFRCAEGSLSNAYPLLTLLSDAPQPMDALACVLRLSPRALGERSKALVEAGVAQVVQGGLMLSAQPLLPLLDQVASNIGTAGTHRKAVEQRRHEVEGWRQDQQEFLPGTDAWWAWKERYYRSRADAGVYDGVIAPGVDPQSLVPDLIQWELLAEAGQLRGLRSTLAKCHRDMTYA